MRLYPYGPTIAFVVMVWSAVLLRGASAVEFEAAIGPTIHGRCHMDYCEFGTIKSSEAVSELPDGILFKVYGLSWGSEYAQREDGSEYDHPPKSVDAKQPFTFQVFCSKVRPMIFYPDGAKWQVSRLRPGDNEAVFGVNESIYSDYWAACHHFFPKYATDPLVAKIAPKLGYHFHGGWPNGDEPVDIKRPTDLLR